MNRRDFEAEFETAITQGQLDLPVKIVTPSEDILDIESVRLSVMGGPHIQIKAKPYDDEEDDDDSANEGE